MAEEIIKEEEIKKDETKTFSEEEVQKMLQSETDKRVSQALKTAQEKWQKEYQEKLEAEKSEAEKLAKMSESERLQAEFNKEKEKFESERKQFLMEKLELQTVKEMSNHGLPVEFSKFVMADNADTIKTNIDTFKSQWEQAIEKAVNEKLQGTTPKTATGGGKTITTLSEFGTLPYSERAKLLNENPNLLSQLK